MGSPLVGRIDEVHRALSLLRHEGAVVLVGPSGVGKTALCDCIAAEWATAGGEVLEFRGTQGLRRVPFGALTLAFRVAAGEEQAETLTRLVALVTSPDSKRPYLVVVDDAHLLDDESAGVVSGLAQSGNIALALAVTSGEQVSADITSVWVRRPSCRLQLEPLGPADVAELLTDRLGRDPSDDEVSEIAALSLGYPLYVTAIADEMASQGDADVGAALSLDRGSDRLVSLIERRLVRLDDAERAVFDLVAFAEATSMQVVVGDEHDRLDRLHERGLVRITGDRVRIAHPLLARVAPNVPTAPNQRQFARRLLRGVDHSTEPGDVAALVRKAVAVGVVPDVALLNIAAAVALGWGDYEGVVRLASLAPDDSGLAVLRARAARFVGESPTTEIPVGLDEAELTEYLSGVSQGLAYSERRFFAAIAFLEEGMQAVADPVNRDRLALELMVLSGLAGDIDTLLGAARAVSPTTDPDTRLLAISASQLGEALTLSTSTADETYERGLDVIRQAEVSPFLAEQFEMSRVMVDLAEGRFRNVQRRVAAREERSLSGSWLTVEAVLADAWLPISEAGELADSAVAALETFDPLANLTQARLVADLRVAQSGRLPSDIGSGLQHEPGVAEIDRIMAHRVDAWVVRADDNPTAAKRLIEVGRESIASGHRFWGLCALIDSIRMGHGDDVVADVDHLVITRGSGLAVMAADHARASTSSARWDVSRAWWTGGARVYGIEAALEAADPESPVDCLRVHLMAAHDVAPVVGQVDTVPCPISKRQLEIVMLALQGMSNESIATQLFLSRRTVENHLHRVYAEIGLNSGRDSLTESCGWIAA